MITIRDIEAARSRIAPHIRRTPIMALDQLQAAIPHQPKVTLKLECLQVTGSFKARGAMNRLLGAAKDEIKAGITTASGGNHGLAVARTAFAAKVPATIFVPSNVSPAKVVKMKAWNAKVEIVGDEWSQSNQAAHDYAKKTGAAYFHPFADPLVVAGQGTLGLEILDDLSDIDAILIAIGGGGLISGLGTVLKARRPDIRIIGIEPVGSPTLRASIDAGHVVTLAEVTSRVPTMTCRRTDERIYETVRDTVDDIVLVSDEEMAEASRFLWFEMGIAADLSGAASIAALRKNLPQLAGAKHVCALVCGAGPEGTV
ncbi:pyridoxal-phosphate dependent enzyme [Aestuariivirga sp. YIM B02566]|uniref:Pyridoxal-phosphate dependent enzyme n=1 Tax=Taklimakanibacter albus TaxID=2800327 RepID=A0ACC5R064_9HYPH|nr:pyridoxal-phosphate dependent enzyme [Aestuariivirga sp. YIM B02566]